MEKNFFFVFSKVFFSFFDQMDKRTFVFLDFKNLLRELVKRWEQCGVILERGGGGGGGGDPGDLDAGT